MQPTLRGLMEAPSVGNFHREASSSTTSEERQFARFLDAANQVGDNLDAIFANGFAKIIGNTPQTNQPGASLTPEIGSSGNVTRIAQAGENSLRENQPSTPSLEMESLLIIRLHFAEAMMVLIFGALNNSQRNSIRQHFATLLEKCDSLESLGVPPATIQAYRDALRAMENMLASNPKPEETAVA